MPEVKTWQACALALNFDPDSLERSPQEWMAGGGDVFQSDSFPSDEVMRQHEDLLRVLEANRFNAQLFTPAHNFKDPVRLSEFAAWCAPVVRDLTGGDIPEELAALAKAAPQAAAKAEAAPHGTPAAKPPATNKQAWDNAKLRALYEESILPGVTHKGLGEKYGVSRSRIGVLLKDARERFGIAKSSQYSQLMQGNRVHRGSKY